MFPGCPLASCSSALWSRRPQEVQFLDENGTPATLTTPEPIARTCGGATLYRIDRPLRPNPNPSPATPSATAPAAAVPPAAGAPAPEAECKATVEELLR